MRYNLIKLIVQKTPSSYLEISGEDDALFAPILYKLGCFQSSLTLT